MRQLQAEVCWALCAAAAYIEVQLLAVPVSSSSGFVGAVVQACLPTSRLHMNCRCRCSGSVVAVNAYLAQAWEISGRSWLRDKLLQWPTWVVPLLVAVQQVSRWPAAHSRQVSHELLL